MSQSNGFLPTSSLPGLTAVNTLNSWMTAISTTFSGSAAPVTDGSAVTLTGQQWLDTATAGYLKAKLYDGTSSIEYGRYDTTNHWWVPPIGGGTATVASNTTTDLWSVPQAAVTVSGTTPITALASASAVPGTVKKVTFSGVTTLTHNATSLILPTAANITTAAGDTAEVEAVTSTNVRVRSYQLASGAPLSTTAVGAQQLVATAQGMNAPLNLRLSASVGSSALTVTIKSADDSTPSAAKPVLIVFRDPAVANGDPIVSSLQAALSFTVASTNTLGASSGNIPFRLWVIAYYNGGTLAAGLFNASTATQIFGLPEGALVTTAVSTNGGNSAGTHYANVSTITNTPFRILGYLEWASGLATAGTWASAPTSIVLFGPGIKKPGDIVQTVLTQTGAVATGTTVLPNDDTIPQITEGDQYMSQAITPTSAANLLDIEVSALSSNASSGAIVTALFQDAIAGALCAMTMPITPASIVRHTLRWVMLAASASAITFRTRVGSASGTTTFNGSSGSRSLGGVANSFMRVTEIMG